MSERLKISPEEATKTVLNDGTEIVVQPQITQSATPGPVALHESAHVVAAGQIVEADIIPRGGALGITQPVRMTAPAAAAAGAMGYEGTGWDRFITEYYLDTSWMAAMAVASAILSGQEDLMYEVATELEERKRITQTDVEEAKQTVYEKSAGIFPVEVAIFQSGKQVEAFTTKSFHGEVEVKVEEVPEEVKY